MISFVYYFHSTRTENLKQSLRMLFKREKRIGEVILVCNDRTEDKFENCSVYNMNLENYEKPKMCNFGVSKASCEIVAILDSDRVLPYGYFEAVEDRIKPRKMFSCGTLLQLVRPHSDEEIDSGNLECEMEEKSRGWELRRKNLFSGNTTFMKSDYVSLGGMDERFVGYGFADNDMTYNVMNNGTEAVWVEGSEVHLYHEKETMERNEIVGFERYRHTSQKNLNRFLRKWKLREYEDYHRKMML